MSTRGGILKNARGSVRSAGSIHDGFGDNGGGEIVSGTPTRRFNENYLEELNKEKSLLDHDTFPHSVRLVSHEINRVTLAGDQLIDLYTDKPTQVAVKVKVPVDEHPEFNFIGKILGPKGNSLRRLQEDTGCRISVCGRGSMRDKAKEEVCRKEGGKYAHLREDLHVYVECSGHAIDVYGRVSLALQSLRKFLVPDYNDEISQSQVHELAIMTGKSPAPPPRPWGMEGPPRPPQCPPQPPGGMPRPPFSDMRVVRGPGPRPPLGRGGMGKRPLGATQESFIAPGGSPYTRAKRPKPASAGVNPTGPDSSAHLSAANNYGPSYEYDSSLSTVGHDNGGPCGKLLNASSQFSSHHHSSATNVAASNAAQYPGAAGYHGNSVAPADIGNNATMATDMLAGPANYPHANLSMTAWDAGNMNTGYPRRMQSVQGGQSSADLSGPHSGSMGGGFSSMSTDLMQQQQHQQQQHQLNQQQAYEQQLIYGQQQQQQYGYY